MSVVSEAPPLSEESLNYAARNLHEVHDAYVEEAEAGQTQRLKSFLNALFETSLTIGISPSHRVAACNLYCAVIEACLISKSDDLASLVCSSIFCNNLLDIYTDRYGYAKAKATKQVLNTLTKLYIASTTRSPSCVLLQPGIERLLEILSSSSDYVKAKAAVQGLSHFLMKGLVSGMTLIDTWHEKKHIGARHAKIEAFLQMILDWISRPDLGPSIGQFLSIIVMDLKKGSLDETSIDSFEPDSSRPIWTKPLLRLAVEQPENVQALKNYVFPRLFKLDTLDYWRFLAHLRIKVQLETANIEPFCVGNLQISSENAALLLFTALQVGKENGLVQESSESVFAVVDPQQKTIDISDEAVGNLLGHESHTIRICSLGLLISSYYSTRPFTQTSLESLRKYLPHMHADVESHFRSSVQSLIVTLVSRLKAVIALLAKQIQKQQRMEAKTIPPDALVVFSNNSEMLQYHRDFVEWYLKFTISELHPLASYQRHATALHTIHTFLRSGLDVNVLANALPKSVNDQTSWPFSIPIMGPGLRRVLLELLVNPFDDVRQASLLLLKLTMSGTSPTGLQYRSIAKKDVNHDNGSEPASEVSTEPGVRHFQAIIGKTTHMMLKSGRADHADGMARTYALLNYSISEKTLHSQQNDTTVHDTEGLEYSVPRLVHGLLTSIENCIAYAFEDLAIAVDKYPLHGYFTALRYVLSDIGEHNGIPDFMDAYRMYERMYRITDRTWDRVRHLLCNDAPEGSMPEEMETNSAITTKDVLSYAWLSLKESSLLIRTIVHPKLMHKVLMEETDFEHYLKLFGTLSFHQLAELRHRGAFSTVAQTFTFICQQCSYMSSASSAELVIGWYKRTLTLIEQRGANLTRRSAGIPALMVSILSANIQGPLFDEAIIRLQYLVVSTGYEPTNKSGDLPQVHALNCLRAIFTNAKFGNRLERCLVDVMRVAAGSIRSSIWAVRNCGLMLFRSLIDRLLGTNESIDDSLTPGFAMSSRLSYAKFSGLADLLVDLLGTSQVEETAATGSASEIANDSAISEAVFPVLDLLRRATPPRSHLERFKVLVMKASGDRQWHVRDMAARTYTSLVIQDSGLSEIQHILEHLPSSPNALHGKLLVLKRLCLAARSIFSPEDVLRALFSVRQGLKTTLSQQCHPVTLSACVDILNIFGEHALSNPYDNVARAFFDASLDIHDTLSKAGQATSINILVKRSVVLNQWIRHLVSDSPTDLPPGYLLDSLPEDAALSVLQGVANLVQRSDRRVFSLMIQLLCQNLSCCDNVHVVSAGQSLLAEILDATFPVKDWNDIPSLKAYLNSICVRDKLQERFAPSVLECDLRIWGYCIAAKSQGLDRWSMALVEEVEAWLRIVAMSSIPSNDFSTRHAAALSIQRFASALVSDRIPPLPESLEISLMIRVHDILNDDDDDIRECGAVAVSKVLGFVTGSTNHVQYRVPPVADREVFDHLKQQSSPKLAREALARVLGQRLDQEYLLFQSIETTFEEATREDNALFVVEKQNLYMDEMKEAFEWSEVLKTTPAEHFTKHEIEMLNAWALKGVEILLDRTAESKDGAFGWTSKAEVFLLGTRIFLVAEILFEWNARSTGENIAIPALEVQLLRLSEMGQNQDLHQRWQEKIEAILQKQPRSKNIKMTPSVVIIIVVLVILVISVIVTFWWKKQAKIEIDAIKANRKERADKAAKKADNTAKA